PVGPMLPRLARLCRSRRSPRPADPRKTSASRPRTANSRERLTLCWRKTGIITPYMVPYALHDARLSSSLPTVHYGDPCIYGRRAAVSRRRAAASTLPLRALDRDVLERRRIGEAGDLAERGFAHSRTVAVEKGEFPDRRIDHLLMDQPL